MSSTRNHSILAKEKLNERIGRLCCGKKNIVNKKNDTILVKKIALKEDDHSDPHPTPDVSTGPTPFDQLTDQELQSISDKFLNEIYKDVSFPEKAVFDVVNLIEPPKKEVLEWMAGGPLPKRLASVPIYIYETDTYLQYAVHLVNGEVHHVDPPQCIKCARPGFTCRDDLLVEELVLHDPRVRAALHKRGLTDDQIANNIFLNICVDGRLDNCSKKKRCGCCNSFNCEGEFRIIKETKPRPHTFYTNFYYKDSVEAGQSNAVIQPIEGVYAIVNVNVAKILKVVDTGVVLPINKGKTVLDRPLDDTLKPLNISQPDGPSYTINGSTVEWQGWKFTVGFNSVTNLEFYNVSFLDRTVWVENPSAVPVRRGLYYKVNVPELITSYSDPASPQKAFNFLDMMEYPARDFTPPLIKGLDVPPNAQLFTVPVLSPDGAVFQMEDAFAIYEATEGMLWRHCDYPCAGDVITNGRSGRILVVTTTVVVGNYDYAFYYIFYQDGRVEIRIRATGIMICAATEETTVDNHHGDEQGGDNIGGPLVYRNAYAIKHRHIALFRFDMMIDGLESRVYEREVNIAPPSEENPCGNLFMETERLLKTEKEAISDHNFNKGRAWVVESSHSKNYLGYHRGIELIPNPTPIPASNNCERITKRATYFKHNFFVTKYRDGEIYAMGKYPVEKGHDQGLGKYIKNNESIVDQNNVIWYQTSFVHTPHIEQVPIMNYEELKVIMLPHNFFNENPGLYLSNLQQKLCGEE